MTLIAGFFKDACPILMGDLLISDTDKMDKEFVFPTVGRVSKSDLSNGEYSPSKLSQKVILVSPKLAISWAGTKVNAISFIEKIIEANLHNNPSYESLLNVYNDIDDQSNISIIGLYRDGKEMRIFDFNSWPVDPPNPEFKYFKAAGSGYGTLLDLVPTVSMDVTSGKPNKLERGISNSLLLITSLLSKEIIDPSSLQELFGVGYEIVHPIGSDLSKFENITYVFWTVEEEKKGSWRMVPFPFLAFNYSYQGDILIIRSVRTSSIKYTKSCKIDSNYLHIISPTHRTVDPHELTNYYPSSLNSKWMCNIFLWKNVHGEMGTYASFGYYANQSPPVIWTNEFNKNKGIDINNEFLKSSITKVALQARSRD
jgi:hypothetical protein